MRKLATISSKGQVTIPQEIRERLGLERGDRVEFVTEGGVTYLRPARSEANPFVDYAGVLAEFGDTDEVNAWVRDLRDEE